jgi:hypothetical protein
VEPAGSGIKALEGYSDWWPGYIMTSPELTADSKPAKKKKLDIGNEECSMACSAPISHTLPAGIASSYGARLLGSGLGALTAL